MCVRICTLQNAYAETAYCQDRALLLPYGSVSTMLSPGDTSTIVAFDDQFSLCIKGVALLDKASRLAARGRGEFSGITSSFTTEFESEIITLHTKLDLFITSMPLCIADGKVDSGGGIADPDIPPPYRVQVSAPMDNAQEVDISVPEKGNDGVIPVYSLTMGYGALMEVHSIRASSGSSSYIAMVHAAETVAQIAHDAEKLDIAGSAYGVCSAWRQVSSDLWLY